jgi:hypothetical protein
MSGIPALVVTIVTLLLTVLGACGIGARSRIIGLHLPFVVRNEATWIAGHRAALITILPTSSVATVLNIISLATPHGNSGTAQLAWILWITGLVLGASAAVVNARRVASRASAAIHR